MIQASLLKVSQIAERLNCSNSTVYALVEGKKLGCHRIGNGRGAIRVSEDDLQTYLESNHVVPPNRGGEITPPPRPRVKLKHIRL
jgi:excisionase family DNA binding protein